MCKCPKQVKEWRSRVIVSQDRRSRRDEARRVDGTYVKKTRPVEGPTFNGANKILEIIVTPEPTPNPPLHIMKSPEHLGFGSNYRSLYFIFGLKVRPKMLAAC